MLSDSHIGERNLPVDMVKIMAMCMVVALHSIIFFWQPYDSPVAYVLYNLSVAAVPLFFMASGYILIGRFGVGYGYSLRKVVAVLSFIVVIVGVRWLLLSVKHGIDFDMLAEDMGGTIAGDGAFYVFWYMYALCLVYLVYPVINLLYRRKKLYYGAFVALAVIECVVFVCNVTSGFETHVLQVLRIWNWLFYFMLGGVLREYGSHVGWKPLSCMAVVVVSAVVMLSVMLWLYPKIGICRCEFFYSCPLVSIFCASLFMMMICSFSHVSGNRAVALLAQLLLPVYSLHAFTIYFTAGYLQLFCGFTFGCVAYWLMVLSVTVAVSWLIMRIPVGRLLFRL